MDETTRRSVVATVRSRRLSLATGTLPSGSSEADVADEIAKLAALVRTYRLRRVPRAMATMEIAAQMVRQHLLSAAVRLAKFRRCFAHFHRCLHVCQSSVRRHLARRNAALAGVLLVMSRDTDLTDLSVSSAAPTAPVSVDVLMAVVQKAYTSWWKRSWLRMRNGTAMQPAPQTSSDDRSPSSLMPATLARGAWGFYAAMTADLPQLQSRLTEEIRTARVFDHRVASVTVDGTQPPPVLPPYTTQLWFTSAARTVPKWMAKRSRRDFAQLARDHTIRLRLFDATVLQLGVVPWTVAFGAYELSRSLRGESVAAAMADMGLMAADEGNATDIDLRPLDVSASVSLSTSPSMLRRVQRRHIVQGEPARGPLDISGSDEDVPEKPWAAEADRRPSNQPPHHHGACQTTRSRAIVERQLLIEDVGHTPESALRRLHDAMMIRRANNTTQGRHHEASRHPAAAGAPGLQQYLPARRSAVPRPATPHSLLQQRKLARHGAAHRRRPNSAMHPDKSRLSVNKQQPSESLRRQARSAHSLSAASGSNDAEVERDRMSAASQRAWDALSEAKKNVAVAFDVAVSQVRIPDAILNAARGRPTLGSPVAASPSEAEEELFPPTITVDASTTSRGVQDRRSPEPVVDETISRQVCCLFSAGRLRPGSAPLRRERSWERQPPDLQVGMLSEQDAMAGAGALGGIEDVTLKRQESARTITFMRSPSHHARTPVLKSPTSPQVPAVAASENRQ